MSSLDPDKAECYPPTVDSSRSSGGNVVGVMGGSGLYALDALEQIERINVETPYGPPSGPIIRGVLFETPMAFLPRHGEKHHLLPSEINFRANIWALKSLGCERIVSVSAVGSMRAEIEPGDLVFVDQFIDWTRHRPMTFLGEGLVGHVALADPVSMPLHDRLLEVAEGLEGIRCHPTGTYICIEGPQFSTRAESRMFRHFGVDVIGMTNLPEARLAREAEIAYATVALATDYDCWKDDEDHVETAAVLEILRQNVDKAKRVISAYAKADKEPLDPIASTALRGALLTPVDSMPDSAKQRLAPIIARWS